MVKKVQCVIFRSPDKPQFLILHRIKEKGGYWQNVTGSVEEGEDSLSAAKREVKEETGVDKDSILTIYEDLFKFNFSLPAKGDIEEKVYAFEVKPGTKIDTSKNVYPEHDDYRWVGADEAVKLIKWKSNKEAVEKTLEALKRDGLAYL